MSAEVDSEHDTNNKLNGELNISLVQNACEYEDEETVHLTLETWMRHGSALGTSSRKLYLHLFWKDEEY